MNPFMSGALLVLWLAVFSGQGQEVFHKDLTDQLWVSVSEAVVADWHKTNDTISAKDFALKLIKRDMGEQVIWTNRHHIFQHADPSTNLFRVFDVMLFDNQLHVCYQDGARFIVQDFQSSWLGTSPASISRFELARVPMLPERVVLTNAAFGVFANGTKTLTAQGTGGARLMWEQQDNAGGVAFRPSGKEGAVLVWEHQHNDWVLNQEMSGPEKVKQRVETDYEHWSFPAGQ